MEVRYWGVRLHHRGLLYWNPLYLNTCKRGRRVHTGREAGELMWLCLRLRLLVLLKLDGLREQPRKIV